jgi:hypothetical protein
VTSPDPPLTPPHLVDDALRDQGSAVVSVKDLAAVLHEPTVTLGALQRLAPSWDDLPLDEHLKGGGHYRRRRHASFVVDGGDGGDGGDGADGAIVRLVPHRAHWQPASYNALHGGIIRWFAPISDDVAGADVVQALLRGLGRVCDRLRGPTPWYVEAHQFRIDTTGGIGQPTPEGAHRDGVDVVVVMVVDRRHVIGGETRVFAQQGTSGVRFTLREPWTALILDDERVVHETTAIRPDDGPGHRDTLVLTFRRGGFQDPPPVSAPGG